MSSSTTSPTLLSRVRNPADRVAWREFDERYGEMIVRYGRRCGLQHADAEDIRQIVMVRLSKALLGFNYSPLIGKFRSFVGRIVRNEVIRLISRPKIASRRVDSDGGELREPINEEKLDRQWEREWADHHLRRAVTLLRRTHEPRSVDVFEQLLAGQTVECVAADFSMTTQAVHKVKQRIRNRLKEIIAGQIREEDQPNG